MTDNANLPISGVNLVAANFPAFEKAMEKANKLIEEQGKKAEATAKQSMKATDAGGQFEKGIQSLIQRFTAGNPAVQKAGALLNQFGIELAALPAGALAAVGAVVAIGAAFVALGNRGAALIGLAESFDRLTNSVGITSATLLKDLRAAAAGTVSDFDLIRRANFALAGAVGEFGTQFAEKLPKLLEIARVQARATGQDVNYLFQSLVTGVKRGTPLLIDNTGIVLKVSQANQDYAESLGKTVEQLTSEEKQIALLNATLEAGQTAIDALGNAHETAAEKIARGQATITNILDTLAVAVQPAYEGILDANNNLLGQFDQLAKALGPVITEIANFIGGLVANTINWLSMLLQPVVDIISGIAPYVTLALRTINTVVGGIQAIVQGVAKNIFGFVGSLKELPKALFEGAAAAFGSFANAIIMVANQLIFPAILGIAQFIADFLIGLSPPPKGPLSQIDKGGANVMTAWLEGITGVSLDPVQQVAAEVEAALGNIGALSAKQVEARLAQLDAALLPFQNRLDIVKSTFDAIAEPAKAALDAIDRQQAAALEALGQGDEAAAALIRHLDMQRDSIQGVLDGQQRLVDNAQIQLALAKAQQARERTLLEIQKARVAVEDKVAKKVKEKGGRIKKGKKPKVGAEPTPAEIGGGVGIGALPETGVLGEISGQDAVDQALAGLTEAFTGQIDTTALQDLQSNSGKLNQLLGTIGEVDLGAKLREKFGGLVDLFDPAVAGSPANLMFNFVHNLFGDDVPTSIPNLIANISLDRAAENVRSAIQTIVNLFDATVAGSPGNLIFNFVDGLINPEREGSIPYKFGRLGVEIINKGVQIRTDIQSVIDNIFDPERETSITYKALDFVDSIINPEREGSIPAFFAQLPNNIATAIGDIGAVIQQVVIAPIAAFLTGEGEGTLNGIINSAVAFFASLPGRIAQVLAGLGLLAFNVIVKPIEQVINSLIQLVEEAVKGLLQSIIDILSPQLGTVLDVGGVLTKAVEALRGAQASIHFDRLNIAPPEFLTSAANAGTTNNTTNNTFNISAPGAAEFAMRSAAFAGAGLP